MPENFNENYQFENQPEAIMAPVCPGGQLYTVKSGDTLFFIARRFNISLQSLINTNPQILDPNSIYPGQVICIPSVAAGPGTSSPGGQIYRVVGGDTMFEIARRFGVTFETLITANPQITNPDLIYHGQEIYVPLSVGTAPCPGGSLYAVKPGDTMFEIAKMNNISLAILNMANPQISDPNMIFPGQVICVPKPAIEQPAANVPMMPGPGFAPPPTPMLATPMPTSPMPTSPMPTSPMHTPASIPMPYQAMGPMTQPMPVYIVIPWEECPYRNRQKEERALQRVSIISMAYRN